MNCEICTFDTSIDSVMWTCAGCPRKFHAACIGVTVQRGSLRRRDKNLVDVNSYVLPCCDSCQELLQAKLDFNGLVEQQKRLEKQLHDNTEVMHRLASQHKPDAVHEAFESMEKGLETLLTSIKNELSAINKSSSLAGSVVAIKNHVTSLFDTAMSATKDNMHSTLKVVTSDLSTDLRNINNEISLLNQQSIELAANCTMNTNAMLGIDILDELKTLSANICASHNIESPLSTPDPCSSLAAELNYKKDSVDSGWRFLGTRKVWMADWSQYDARKLHRLNQQKMADKARKRKKQNKNQNIQNNNATHHVQNHRRSTSHTNPNNNNNNNNNNNINNYNHLPSDRVLLAAAKHQFSRPPLSHRPIYFQSGGIQNPYPASDASPLYSTPTAPTSSSRIVPAQSPNWMAPGRSSAEPCEGCSCSQRHSSFHRY